MEISMVIEETYHRGWGSLVRFSCPSRVKSRITCFRATRERGQVSCLDYLAFGGLLFAVLLT